MKECKIAEQIAEQIQKLAYNVLHVLAVAKNRYMYLYVTYIYLFMYMYSTDM